MNDFKKNNRFGGGGDRRGGDFGRRDFGGRPSFGGGNRGGFGGGRELELHQATCASCGKSCEVPFKPNGKKPVYCKECFAANGGPAASAGRDNRENSFAPRRDFAPASAPAYKPEARAEHKTENTCAIADLRKQMDSLNTKLDKIMSMIGGKEAAPAAKPVVKAVEKVAVAAPAPVEKKPAAKKAAAKKKK